MVYLPTFTIKTNHNVAKYTSPVDPSWGIKAPAQPGVSRTGRSRKSPGFADQSTMRPRELWVGEVTDRLGTLAVRKISDGGLATVGWVGPWKCWLMVDDGWLPTKFRRVVGWLGGWRFGGWFCGVLLCFGDFGGWFGTKDRSSRFLVTPWIFLTDFFVPKISPTPFRPGAFFMDVRKNLKCSADFGGEETYISRIHAAYIGEDSSTMTTSLTVWLQDESACDEPLCCGSFFLGTCLDFASDVSCGRVLSILRKAPIGILQKYAVKSDGLNHIWYSPSWSQGSSFVPKTHTLTRWVKPCPFHPRSLEVTLSPLDFGSRELTIPKRSRLESPGSYFLVFRGGFLRVETCQTHITLLQRPTGFLQFVCVPMWQDSCGLGIPSNGGDIVREVSPKCLNSSGLGSIVIYPD